MGYLPGRAAVIQGQEQVVRRLRDRQELPEVRRLGQSGWPARTPRHRHDGEASGDRAQTAAGRVTRCASGTRVLTRNR